MSELTGKLLADFSSFTTACAKAEVSLKDFEGASEAVAKKLTTVSDSLSGVRIVQQATIAAEAVDRIGGISKLTEAELARVGAVAQEAAAKLTAMGQTVPPKIQAIADAAHQTSGAFGELFTHFTAGVTVGTLMASGIEKVGDVALEGAHKVVEFFADSVTAAAAYEVATARLTSAVITSGHAADDSLPYFKALAEAIAATTATSEVGALEMQARFIQLGGVTKDQMAGATQAALNLAAGLRIDLETAVTMVSKALEGNLTGLKRVGVQLDATRFQAEGASYVFAALNDRFGGQAQIQAETYAGQVKRVGNAWEEFQAVVGKTITEDPIIDAVLHRTITSLQGITEEAETNKTTMTDWAAQLAEQVVPMGGAWIVLAEKVKDEAIEEQNANVVHALTAGLWEKMNGAAMLHARELPPITAGLKLWEEGTKALAAAQENLLALQQPLGTAARQEIDNYQKLGVSAKDIAAIMELKVAVVEHEIKSKQEATVEWEKADALESRIAEDSKVRWAETAQLKAALSLSTTDKQKADLEVWVAKEKEVHVRAKTDTADFYLWLGQQSALMTQRDDLQRVLSDSASRASFEKRKAAADDWLAFVMGHVSEFTNADIDQAVKRAATATTEWSHWGQVSSAALGKTKSDLAAVTAAAEKARLAIGDPTTTAITRENFAANTRGLGGNEGLVEALLKQGYSFEQALLWSKHPDWAPPATPGPRVPGFAEGGTVMVGEHGAEAVRLPFGSQVFPSGSGGGDTHLHVTINASGLLLSNSPSGRAEFARFAKDAIVESWDRQGRFVPERR